MSEVTTAPSAGNISMYFINTYSRDREKDNHSSLWRVGGRDMGSERGGTRGMRGEGHGGWEGRDMEGEGGRDME